MKRKMIAIVLGLTMIVSSLAGCGSSDTTEKPTDKEVSQSSVEASQSSGTSSEVSEETVELEEKTIQLWMVGPGKQKDSDMVWEAFNEKLQEYVPNTTVEISVFSDAEYKEKFNQMLASGEAVDCAWVGYQIGNVDSFIADGSLLPIDDMLEQYGQGIIDFYGQDIIDFNAYTDGKQYCVSAWQGKVTGMWGLRVPNELAELAGDTWIEDTQEIMSKWWNTKSTADDFQAVFDQIDIYCAALKEAGKLYSGIDVRSVFQQNYAIRQSSSGKLQMNNIGVVGDDETFTVIDMIDTEHYRVYAKNMAEFYKKGYIRSDIASVDINTLTTVTNGEYTENTFILTAGGAIGSDESVKQSTTAKFGMDATVIRIEDADKGYYGSPRTNAMGFPYCADEPERAMMVLNALFAEPELYQLLIYGIEGVHYTDNGDGTVTTPYGAQGKENSDYGLWRWTIGTCINSLCDQTTTPGYYEDLRKLEKEVSFCPFVKFVFDDSSVKAIISSLSAIDGEYKDMISKGYTGDDWEATLDQWIAERKEAGVDTLIAEYQKQLDAFIEENNITSWRE